ncbi:MAG TPA: cell division ATP-binding protein FtsE [Nitrospiraceae bacterium]|jgi:cell division transport system ATP-binding protein|nr:cell division ATP-binding protein FtsE [Nitrospiraceae bacterium]
MIQLFHVSKYYDRRPALQDINLQIEKGEFVWLMGPSGAGKTTLLKLLFCAEQPDEGQILVQGRNVARLRSSAVPYLRRTMGLVFQDFRLLPKKSVFENVALPLMVQGASPFDIRRKVAETLKAVGVEHKRGSRPATLSAGEQQRVCIARAIVNGPIILLADEPTGNLDPELSGEILELFKVINARGTTVMLATHNRQLVEQVRRRVVTLDQGKLVSDEVAPS